MEEDEEPAQPLRITWTTPRLWKMKKEGRGWFHAIFGEEGKKNKIRSQYQSIQHQTRTNFITSRILQSSFPIRKGTTTSLPRLKGGPIGHLMREQV
jgi:hypothetical protein